MVLDEVPGVFDFDLSYHLGKANVVVDALSQYGGKRSEKMSERNALILVMIHEYTELKFVALFDIEFSVEAKYGQEVVHWCYDCLSNLTV